MELIKEKQLIPETNEQPTKKKKDWRYELWDNVKTIGITVVITLLFMNFVAQLAVVKGESMANTFHDSNIVLLEKLTQRFSSLERFDVVVFNTNNPDKPHYIKRIIGLPGDSVRIDANGVIYINGEALEEHYGREIIQDPGLAINEITLGDDEYFLVGDNRNNSIDSRFEQVGIVKEDEILGRVAYGLSPFVNPAKQQGLNN